jgi:hypothetical protein
VAKIEGFEVQSAYVEIGRIRHTCELFHPLNKLGDLFLSNSQKMSAKGYVSAHQNMSARRIL